MDALTISAVLIVINISLITLTLMTWFIYKYLYYRRQEAIDWRQPIQNWRQAVSTTYPVLTDIEAHHPYADEESEYATANSGQQWTGWNNINDQQA
jgi:hypothetical protein